MAGGEKEGAKLDGQVKQKLMPLTSEAVAACLPSGQYKPFPANQFALMTSTGAKGGPVNFSQIAVMLGQQELEGRRVPLSPSGCTARGARGHGCEDVALGLPAALPHQASRAAPGRVRPHGALHSRR